MPWRTIVEEGEERTEVFEIARRGCLVRIGLREGDQWKPVTMTWCPGLKATDFMPAVVEAEAPAQEEATAAPAADPDAPDLLGLAQAFAKLQTDVLAAFRAKMGCGSGRLGFLESAPQVGGFSAPGRGDWVWRIDESSVSLSSRKQVLEFPLPNHSQDTAFSSAALANYLRGVGQHAVSCDGGVHPVEATTMSQLLDRLVQQGKLREFTRVPNALYMIV